MAYRYAMAYVTSREVVQSRGISHRTLLRMIETGEIVPAQKLPTRTGAYLFDPAEVDRAFAVRNAKHGQDDERVSA